MGSHTHIHSSHTIQKAEAVKRQTDKQNVVYLCGGTLKIKEEPAHAARLVGSENDATEAVEGSPHGWHCKWPVDQ